MEKQQILSFINKNFTYQDIDKIKEQYQISYGKYDDHEIRSAIKAGCPVMLKDNRIIVGVFPDGKFIDHNENKFNIERPVDGIILSGVLESMEVDGGDALVIPGRMDMQPDDNFSIIEALNIGPVFLPPHSVIVNFITPTDVQKKEKIVSDLTGVNINIYYIEDDYIGNIFHEMGHLIWRTRLNYDEKKAFDTMSRGIRSPAIYQYDWERKSGEEVFCTVYKWYMKSIYVNKSFYNILNHEEPQALHCIQGVFDRLTSEMTTAGIWQGVKNEVVDYVNPRLDVSSGKYIRKRGTLDRIRDIELPTDILADIHSIRDGVTYIHLTKAVKVPIKGRKIDYANVELKPMQKALRAYKEYRDKVLYLDMDGVIADFATHYKKLFGRDPYKDDYFTIQQFCKSEPNFFRDIPELPRGRKLYESLKDKYNVIILTAPMPEMPYCKIDKAAWIKQHFPEIKTIIFSSSKADYSAHEGSVLIDDMAHNLIPWAEAGGTAIDFEKMSNDKILTKIDEVLNPKEKIKIEGKTELEPTEAQKESGNYAKGVIEYKGLKIKIENPAGSIRFGFGLDGKKWVNKMKSHYGYIVNGYEGPDNDKIDCFVNPAATGSRVFVINQVTPDGMFDEHKIMIGYGHEVIAERAYLENYQKGWDGIGSIVKTNTKKLREWLESGNHLEPFK